MTAHPESMARIECKFHGDPRLIAGAATIVAHIARRAGLSEPVASEISAVAIEACNAILKEEGEVADLRAMVQLSAAEFPDHIEISTQLLSQSSNAGRSQKSSGLPADLAEKLRQALNNAAVDGAGVEVTDGVLHISLVKNCGAANRRFAV